MANTISSVAESIQFFGQEVLSQLRARLALVGIVNRDYSGATAAHGQTINIPSLAISGTARTRAIAGAVTTDDVSSSTTSVTMQQVYKSIKLDNLQQTFSNVNLADEYAQRLAIQLANGADSLLTDLWYKIPYEVGTADGTAAFGSTPKLTALAAARKVLSNNLAPVDRLQAVVGPTEAYNIRALDIYNQANTWGSAEGRQTGDLGTVQGFSMRESQNAPSTVTLTTAATWGTPLVNNGAGYAIGDTSIAVDGLGAGDIKKGSCFRLGGNNYAVTADVTTAAGAATISITPPLKTAVADNDAITFATGNHGLIGGHSAAGSVGFAYDPDAFLFVVRPQVEFIQGAGVAQFSFSDPDSGLSFRLNIEAAASGGAGTAMHQVFTADMLCGAALVRPELAVRISGQV